MTVEIVCKNGKCDYEDRLIKPCRNCNEVDIIEHELLKQYA